MVLTGYPDAMIEVTDWARDILSRSQKASSRFNPDAVIRLARIDGEVQAILAEEPLPNDERLQVGDVTLYLEKGLEGLLDVEEPHDRLVLRPSGSPPNVAGEH
jgi:hypothetical protein